MPKTNQNKPTLKRKLGFWLLAFYGLGNILGAGIYVLIGKVVGSAGYYAPLSFLLAAGVAGITALTYAELSSRFPRSAGEAVYLYEGFRKKWLSVLTGLLIAAAGMLSAATIARGFTGYAQVFLSIPDNILIVSLLCLLGLIAIWGIGESIKVAGLLTLIELAGLVLIVVVASPALVTLPTVFEQVPAITEQAIWPGIFTGAFLAFYAFIGFEDMVNVAEEVKEPEKNMPKAIFFALIVATIMYGLVSLVSVASFPPDRLANSAAPLAEIYREATGKEPVVITVISLFAVINGALIQIIMAARIFYGMSNEGWIPALFSRVNPKTRTPVTSTILVTAGIITLALWFPLLRLAESTSFLILTIFTLVNLALITIRKRPAPEGVKVYPAWIPVLGATGSILLLLAQIFLGS